MATVNLTAWYDDVLPHLPSCPVAVALQKIRQAVIAYCRISRTWRYLDLTALDAVAGQQTYVIGTPAVQGTLPAGTVVVHVYQVNYSEVALEALTPAQFRALSTTWFNDAGDPEAFALFNEGELSLWRIPEENVVGAIEIPEVALAPTQTATTVDDRVYQLGREVIAAGAIAAAQKLPKKPYSNPAGEGNWRAFEAAAAGHEARAASSRGHARLRTRTIYR